MAFKDVSGTVALIGLVFTAGIGFTKMTGDLGNLKAEVKKLKSDAMVSNSDFIKGNILLKVQDSSCPDGWEELGKTSIIVDPRAAVNFEKYAEFRGVRSGWPNVDFEMCAKL